MHIVHQEVNESKLSVIAIFFDMAKGGSTTNSFIDEINPNKNNTQIPLLRL